MKVFSREKCDLFFMMHSQFSVWETTYNIQLTSFYVRNVTDFSFPFSDIKHSSRRNAKLFSNDLPHSVMEVHGRFFQLLEKKNSCSSCSPGFNFEQGKMRSVAIELG